MLKKILGDSTKTITGPATAASLISYYTNLQETKLINALIAYLN